MATSDRLGELRTAVYGQGVSHGVDHSCNNEDFLKVQSGEYFEGSAVALEFPRKFVRRVDTL